MTDYSELKRLATKVDSGDYEFDDVLALGKAASPSVMLAILAELEALREVMEAAKHILRDSRSNEFGELADAVSAYEVPHA